jgi:hypothetical protein
MKMTKFEFIMFLLLANCFVAFGQTQLGQNIDVPDTFFAMASSVSSSADGNRVAVGGYGKSDYGIKVYDYDGTNWIQVGNNLNTQYPNNNASYQVSLSADGNRIAVGSVISPLPDFGHVKIYEYDGVDWVQLGNTISGELNGDLFGLVISLSTNGDRLAVGAKFNNNSTGHARVFEYDGTNWMQLGEDIDGYNSGDYFGTSVSLSPDGHRLGVGANQYCGSSVCSGLMRIFEYDGSNWIQIGLDLEGGNTNDGFGVSVSFSFDGNRVAIGAFGNLGYVRVFDYDGANWIQAGADIIGNNVGDRFGRMVSLSNDGSRLAIGAPLTVNNQTGPGYAKIYEYNSSDWYQLGMQIDGDAIGDEFGRDISLSQDGGTVVIGALQYIYQQSGTESGYAKVYDISNLVLSIEDLKINKFIIYPNPATETIQINPIEYIKELSIFDSLGRLVLRSFDIQETIDISSLQRGVYYVNLIDKNKKMSTIKLIKY